MKCSWNSILFCFCLLTRLSLENWDSSAKMYTRMTNLFCRQPYVNGVVILVNKILVTSTQGETTNWIIFQTRILFLLTRLLHQDIVFLTSADSYKCFSLYLLCHRLIQLRMRVFQGFWRICEHYPSTMFPGLPTLSFLWHVTRQKSLHFYNRAWADWISVD